MISTLEVIEPGLLTTIQDYGRHGYREFGIASSGAMDSKAYALANEIVGNPEHSAILEMTLIGSKLTFRSDATIVLTGGTVSASMDDSPIEMYSLITVKADSIIEMGKITRGARCYLAIKGNLQVDRVMNSFSTDLIGKFGGLKGRILKKGDVITWESLEYETKLSPIDKQRIPYYSSKLTVEVLKGPEWDWLDEYSKSLLLESKFEVNSTSNRMGIRLDGEQLTYGHNEMISSPVIPGIVQLPKSGSPIILMNDAQTIGGYLRVLKVLDHELWRLGQVKSGDTIQFKLID